MPSNWSTTPRPARSSVRPAARASAWTREGTTLWHRPGARSTLGKFGLIEPVGVGAFGTVYKARDPQLDRTVAIKVPRAGNLAGGEDLDRFLREARSVAQLRHPAIVPVHEVGEHDGAALPGQRVRRGR